MTITTEQKAEVVKKFLNGTSLQFIVRNTGLNEEQVISIIVENVTTREMLKSIMEKRKRGEFDRFFYESDLGGRPKLPEEKRRKVRQIRISDEEMEALENRNSRHLRSMLLDYMKLEKFCSFLDEKGITLISDELLESEYDNNDPFWKQFIYKNNLTRLESFLGKEKLWEQFQWDSKGEAE